MKWQIIRSNSGYRAVLVAGNGEKIAWTETYVSPASARYALTLIASTFSTTGVLDSIVIEDVDER